MARPSGGLYLKLVRVEPKNSRYASGKTSPTITFSIVRLSLDTSLGTEERQTQVEEAVRVQRSALAGWRASTSTTAYPVTLTRLDVDKRLWVFVCFVSYLVYLLICWALTLALGSSSVCRLQQKISWPPWRYRCVRVSSMVLSPQRRYM